jgi:hypothetical protein
MIMIALCSLLVGAVMGTRFRVQVLFPAAALACATVTIMGLLRGSSASSIVVAALVGVTTLQIGYLGGLLTRFYMAASRIASRRPLRSSPLRS